ncbi:MAG: ATP-binding protein [Brevinematales bacterium]
MEESVQISIQSDFSELKKVRERLKSFLQQCSMSEEKVFQLVLVVDEVVTNTIKYGYEKKSGIVRVKASCRENMIEIVVEDDAPPFNPLDYPPVDMDAHLQKGNTHGLGIHVLRTYADSCSYQRLPDGNQLIIRKKLGS